jgi:deoxyadenosine/deoxycytidine kinase
MSKKSDTSTKLLIAIEGNIGAGKSTFINILKENIDNCSTVDEPVEMWKKITDSDDKNILQKFYEDMPRWAYSFQNVACITRIIKIQDAIINSSKQILFLDRSLGTDKYIFEKMLYDDKIINEMEHQMYNLWCDLYEKYINNNNNIFYIYLKCEPEISLNRIKKRGRVEEESISLEYLKKINKYHDEWLLNKDNVIIIDCNKDFENDLENQNKIIDKIKTQIETFTKKDKYDNTWNHIYLNPLSVIHNWYIKCKKFFKMLYIPPIQLKEILAALIVFLMYLLHIFFKL